MIKSLRLEKGFSQTKLAELLNISRSTESDWETGRSEPGLCDLLNISKICDVSIDSLLGNSDEWGNTTIPAHTVSALSTDEQLLLSAYKKLSPGQKKGLFQMLEIDQTQQIKKGS